MERGSAGVRSSTVRRWGALVVCALALVLAVTAAGCGSDDSAEDAAARRRAAAHARAMAVGRRVFAEHCRSCHTLDGVEYTGEIIEFEAPSLDEVRPKHDYVAWRVEYGGPAMASFSREMSRAQFDALVTYVTETAGASVVDDGDQPSELLAAGREVFDRQCAFCHGIAGRAMSGRPLYPGIDFNLVKPSERLVTSIVRRGIFPEGDMMPAFRGKLSAEQIDAVAAYVTAVAAEGPEAAVSPTKSP
jgi:mono/diheme cytochrome c family protein